MAEPFDPLKYGATPAKKSAFDPIALGATPVKTKEGLILLLMARY